MLCHEKNIPRDPFSPSEIRNITIICGTFAGWPVFANSSFSIQSELGISRDICIFSSTRDSKVIETKANNRQQSLREMIFPQSARDKSEIFKYFRMIYNF